VALSSSSGSTLLWASLSGLSCGAIPVPTFSYEQTETVTDPSGHQEHDAIVLVNCGVRG
jgi:hypothetical protein